MDLDPAVLIMKRHQQLETVISLPRFPDEARHPSLGSAHINQPLDKHINEGYSPAH